MRRYAEWISRHPVPVLLVMLGVTAWLTRQAGNLQVIVDPDAMHPPDHPYVLATHEIDRRFNQSRQVVLIGLKPRTGDVFQPAILEKVERITTALTRIPSVVADNVMSLAARRAKSITGTEDGLEVEPLMERVPRTPAELEQLRRAVAGNPAYRDVILAGDGSMAAIFAEVHIDHATPENGGFRTVIGRMRAIIDRERDASVDIFLGGAPVVIAQLETQSERMRYLFPLAVVIAGLIHYEAFRTIQGLLLPLVTALIAVAWGLGIMGMAAVPLDVFNAATPILILAVAAGHAVQILKRYYEEYDRLRADATLSPREASRRAVVESLVRVGPVMLVAGSVAALGFFSLVGFKIQTVRTFGIFAGVGILNALILEMTLIPALRVLLPAPGRREQSREKEQRVWDVATSRVATWVTGGGRAYIYAVAALLLVCSALSATRLRIDSTFRQNLFPSNPIRVDDRVLNEHLGGTNTLYVMLEGAEPGTMYEPAMLRLVQDIQTSLDQEPYVGKTLSVVDFVKRMHRAMHADDPAYDVVPDSRNLIAQYFLLYSASGDAKDFETFVDPPFEAAKVLVMLKTDSSIYLRDLLTRLQQLVAERAPKGVRVVIGGSVMLSTAVNDVIVREKVMNILQIGGVIFLISSAVFRSLVAGMLVLVPLSLAVAANFGMLGLLGITLNVSTSLITPMAVGVGADYAIYLIFRLREELLTNADEEAAVTAALRTAGKAILFVASAVAGGYGVLALSYEFAPHLWCAMLIAVSMFVSSVSAITVLPSLVLSLRPRFIFGTAPVAVGAKVTPS